MMRCPAATARYRRAWTAHVAHHDTCDADLDQ
jgi:hypothetical protein